MKKIRMKWGNILIFIVFVLSSLVMLNDGINTVFSTIQYTNTGSMLSLAIFIVWFVAGSYLESEMQ